MTLIDVIVAISIFTIGIGALSLFFINIWRQNSYALEMGQAAMSASRGVNEMVRYIREARQSDNGAYPVVSASDNDLVIYCDYDRDGKAERLRFYKSGTNLMMGVREPSTGFPVTYASGYGETRVIASSVVNASNNPVFAYYNSNYPEDSVNNPIAMPVTVPNVRLLRVTLHVNIDPNRAPDNIQIQSFSQLRNLNDHDRFGV